jgi:uncharacterized LabA/DUF88 family protein
MQIALLIDADNVAAKHMPAVFGYLGSIGNIKMAKAFGRASTLHSKKWVEVIQTYAITIKEHQHEGNNSADFSLSIHGTELLIKYPHIGCFCIISSDGDFIHFISRLKESDKKVIGIGNANASTKLRQACDSYVTFSQIKIPVLIPTPKPLSPEERKKQLNANRTLLTEIKSVLAEKSKHNNYVKISSIAGILGNEPRCLKSRDYGYKSWRDLFFDLSYIETKIEGLGQILIRLNQSNQVAKKENTPSKTAVKNSAVLSTLSKPLAGSILTIIKHAFYSTRAGGIDAWVNFETMLAFLEVNPNSAQATSYLVAARSFFEEQSVDGVIQFRFKNSNQGNSRRGKASDNFRVNPNGYRESFHYRPPQRLPRNEWESCMANMGIPSDAWDWYDD